ncbi:phosphatidylethanolamine N-methyltransferase [Pseudovirgaria hyperparasitica]|uniref:Phosphatidyl-N-methylethanolamine N-methyltransferase n=1 Tax=Pseudovirgaria hyperparasitica TaxID=470096 RepID=A0A6A6WIT5_9PEZI|nr:phosphatidylethanolamine N-methyltransferase [Pseudovirgaria hyperparasitica]KAF2761607.1 phosphatidylethanolamine N-methyltransferase [Pseudovirgaria hyperparasitica]
MDLDKLFDFSRPELWVSAASIAFNPVFWNIVAYNEYHHKLLTKLFGGNRHYGCYALAITIFSLGILRDILYERALRSQPSDPALQTATVQYISWGLFLTGNVLVLSSMWALGVTGTYLGDYFGILMDEPVTSFPFSVTPAPMYHGSTLSFLGSALYFAKPAGVLLTVHVAVMYFFARRFEDPFTERIYREREERRGAAGKKRA